MDRLLLIAAAISISSVAGCGAAQRAGDPARPAAGVLAWIPADAVMVVAFDPTDPVAARLVELADDTGWTSPAALVATPEPVAGAWQRAGVAVTPRAWALLDDAGTVARCAAVGDGAAAAIIAAGGTRQRSAGADLIALADTITVVRDGAACTVDGGAASRRARHAARLAGISGPERADALTATDPAVAAALGAPLGVHGPGELVGAIADGDHPPALAPALGARGRVTVAVRAPDDRIVVDVRGEHAAAAPARAPVGDVVPPPPAPPVPALPLPPADENPDVPVSKAYEEAVQQIAERLAEAAARRERLAAAEQRAAAAWRAAWGDAAIEAVRGGLTITWTPPAPRAPHAAAEAARGDLAAERAALDAIARDLEARYVELLKIRARDVAAWDRRSSSGSSQ